MIPSVCCGAALFYIVPRPGFISPAWMSSPEEIIPAYSLTVAVAIALSILAALRSSSSRATTVSSPAAGRALGQRLAEFSRNIREFQDADELGRQLSGILTDTLGARGFALYRGRGHPRSYELVFARGKVATPDAANMEGLVERVNGSQGPVTITPGRSIATGTHAPAQTWVPLRAAGSLVGLIALAAKPGATGFDPEDQSLLAVLSSQAALALRHREDGEQIARQQGHIEALKQRLAAESTSLREKPCRLTPAAGIVGRSEALRRVLVLAERVAPSGAAVLITGETGTGKELLARAIHNMSSRRGRALISVNCPAIPEQLAESELFGHERGAFTDAVAARPGKFELADGGTLFLDEVADLGPRIQAKLLRVLQEGESQRLGGHRVRRVDVRVISATNCDLRAAVRERRFREDLYYRLAKMEIVMPPLRDRAGDITMLASFFLEQATARYGKTITGFTPAAGAALCQHDWPGNVRELQNVLESAVLLCTGKVLRPEHLAGISPATAGPVSSLRATVRDEKKRRILDALAHTQGNQAAAARLLGTTRSNLARMMKSLGIPPLANKKRRRSRCRSAAAASH